MLPAVYSSRSHRTALSVRAGKHSLLPERPSTGEHFLPSAKGRHRALCIRVCNRLENVWIPKSFFDLSRRFRYLTIYTELSVIFNRIYFAKYRLFALCIRRVMMHLTVICYPSYRDPNAM